MICGWILGFHTLRWFWRCVYATVATLMTYSHTHIFRLKFNVSKKLLFLLIQAGWTKKKGSLKHVRPRKRLTSMEQSWLQLLLYYNISKYNQYNFGSFQSRFRVEYLWFDSSWTWGILKLYDSKMATKNSILSISFIFSPCVYTTLDVDSKSWFVL